VQAGRLCGLLPLIFELVVQVHDRVEESRQRREDGPQLTLVRKCDGGPIQIEDVADPRFCLPLIPAKLFTGQEQSALVLCSLVGGDAEL